MRHRRRRRQRRLHRTACRPRTPLVIAFVLALAFVLLLGAFRSPALAAAVMGLNLLSVGAAYGVLVAVFQHALGRGTARLHVQRDRGRLAAAVRLRHPVRAVDGLHDARARAHPRGAARRARRRARRRPRASPRPPARSPSAAVVMVGDLRDLRDPAAAGDEAARRRAGRRGADRRDDRARRGAARGGRRCSASVACAGAASLGMMRGPRRSRRRVAMHAEDLHGTTAGAAAAAPAPARRRLVAIRARPRSTRCTWPSGWGRACSRSWPG